MLLNAVNSSFQSLSVEIFWYPAKKKAAATVFLLKGLYGLHDPQSENSWDMELIEVLNDDFNFVCINTARRGVTTSQRSSEDAFFGKTFEQECNDIHQAFGYLFDAGIITPSSKIYFIANSFGGTTLLGVPKIMKLVSGVVMIGSGCGKSSTTTKPLLTTLYDEERLLTPLRSYPGTFVFIRGSEDRVVPKDSQDKIIDNAQSASVRIVYTITYAQHNLTLVGDKVAPNRTILLASVLRHIMSLS